MADCSFHAHKGEDPCPHCLEAGASVRVAGAMAFDMSTKSYRLPDRIAWIDDCPECANTDLRKNLLGRKIWCAQCGAQAQLIDVTIAYVKKMRKSAGVCC